MTGKKVTTVVMLCVSALLPALPIAQVPLPDGPPVDPALRFEAASIKPYNDNEPTRFRMQPSARLDVTGASVRTLVQNAFRVRGDQVIGLPDWGDRDRYSVTATAPDGTPVTAIPTMLSNLLVDRFSLVTHRETRELETFELVLARDDGKLGPALKPTSAECQAMIAKGAPAPASPPPVGDQAPCGSMQAAAGITRAAGVTLGRLAQMLSQFTGRPVADRTGLTGLHDFTLRFNPKLNLDAAADSSDAPHLFTALPEQLGLRLSSQRGLAQVVVVDSIQKPTAD